MYIQSEANMKQRKKLVSADMETRALTSVYGLLLQKARQRQIELTPEHNEVKLDSHQEVSLLKQRSLKRI